MECRDKDSAEDFSAVFIEVFASQSYLQHPIALLHLLRIEIDADPHLLELLAHLRHAIFDARLTSTCPPHAVGSFSVAA